MMNRKGHTAALLLVLASVLSLGWGDTEEEITAAAEAVKTVRADFVQEKHMKILLRPLVSKGRFVYAAPGSLRWQYTSPIKSLLLMHDQNTARYTFEQGRWAVVAGFDLQAMQVVVEQIAGWLSGRFEQDGLFSARMAPGRRIVLVPKAEGFARFIERIELQLSEKPGVLSSMVMVEGPEAYTRIRFSNVQVNGPIGPSDFTVPQ